MLLRVVLLINFIICSTCFPTTEIPQGHLKGRYLKTDNKRTFSSFTGIPYAEPPVGNLRFELARPAKKWNGTLNAGKLLHPICPQVLIPKLGAVGSEDCLYLNVYTPQLNFSNITKLYPVMIFIHGGTFNTGNANRLFYNPASFLDKDIVLIVPNYRLGPLGFLSTGDEVVPGNNGLKDQNLSIKWVKANIMHFRGNPDRITIFGQSSGAVSAHLHMLSPLSRGLISGVISQSGTAVNYGQVLQDGQGIKNAKKLALFLNCTAASTKEMANCLKKADFRQMTKLQYSFSKWKVDPITPFRPVIEPDSSSAFLTESPAQIIKSGKAAKVPFLTGITTEDGALRSPSFFVNSELLQELNTDFKKIAPIIFGYEDIASDKNHVTRQIKEFYFNNSTIANTSKSELTNAFTDCSFLSGANNAVWLHLNYSRQPVYYYAFGYRGNFSYSSLIDNSFNYGVAHSDDLLYLFSFKNSIPGYKPSETDKNVTSTMTTLWTNFARFGNPTPLLESNPEQWKPVESGNLEYYSIKSGIQMDEKLYWNRTQLWKNLPIHIQ